MADIVANVINEPTQIKKIKHTMIEISYPAIALSSLLLVILGYLVGRFIDHIMIKERSKQDRLISIINEAAISFKKAFVEEINFLKNYGESKNSFDDTYGVLTAALEKHRIAFEAYRLLLPHNRRSSFDKAWT